MKLYTVLFAGLLLLGLSSKSQNRKDQVNDTTASFKVFGVCEQCKHRIESTLKIKGIENAIWDIDTKMLTVSYEPRKISLQKINDKIAIKIKDNGSGISQRALDKIFLPFFTTKPTGEGTGLGLSMSYDIITKGHGGELKVETKEGEYAEFIILLPT